MMMDDDGIANANNWALLKLPLLTD